MEIGSWNTEIKGYDSEEIVWYQPGNFSLWSQNLTCYAELHGVNQSDAELMLHVLNDSQFDVWHQNKTWQDTMKPQNMSNDAKIVINLRVQTRYHYILQNDLNTTISGVFSLDLNGFFLRFDYAGYTYFGLLIVLGAIHCLVFGGRILRILDSAFLGLRFKFNKNAQRWSEDERALALDAYKHEKLLAKLLLVILGLMLVVLLLLNLSKASEVYASPGGFYFPEFQVLFYDVAFRVFLFVAFLVLPLWASFAVPVLIVEPVISGLVKSRIMARAGIRHQTEKQFSIEKLAYNYMFKKLKSWPVLSFVAISIIVWIIIIFFASFGKIFDAYLFVAFTFILGTFGGFIASTSFHEACTDLKIGEYAARRHLRMQFISYAISIPTLAGILIASVLFIGSSSWNGFLNMTLFSPVLMLGSSTSVFEPSTPEILSYFAAGTISAVVLLGALSFILFPAIYKKGRRGITVSIITFSLTYLTQVVFSVVFSFPAVLFQPFAIVSPIVVSVFSSVIHRRYKKAIETVVKPKKEHAAGR